MALETVSHLGGRVDVRHGNGGDGFLALEDLDDKVVDLVVDLVDGLFTADSSLSRNTDGFHG